jgi:hypothetical protein
VGFAVHGPTQRSASPRSHGMPCRDVLRRVQISMISVSTRCALESRLALAVLACGVPTVMTGLRRECCVDFFDPTRCFVVQPTGQPSPGVRAYRTVESRLAAYSSPRLLGRPASRPRHQSDSQILDSDDVKAACEGRRDLLDPVLGSVGSAGENSCDDQLQSPPSGRSRPSSRKSSLQTQQATLFGRAGLRNTEELARREGSCHRHSAIDADDLVVAWRRNRARCRRERYMPALRPVERDPVGLCSWRNSAPAEFDPADFGNPDSTGVLAQPTKMRRLEGNNAKPFVDTSLSPCRPPVGSREVVCHRLAEVPQRLLLNHLRSCTQPVELPSGVGQLPRLREVSRRRSAVRRPMGVLLNGKIPDIASVSTVLQEPICLAWCRLQTEPAHATTVSSVTDSFCEPGVSIKSKNRRAKRIPVTE